MQPFGNATDEEGHRKTDGAGTFSTAGSAERSEAGAETGFTLLEAAFAVGLVAAILLAMLPVEVAGHKTRQAAAVRAAQVDVATRTMAEVDAASYADLPTLDGNQGTIRERGYDLAVSVSVDPVGADLRRVAVSVTPVAATELRLGPYVLVTTRADLEP